MTDQAERYDRIAAGYEQWWAPVLAPSALALLDRLDADVAAGATELLDVGVGTGNLSRPALQRWPSVRVTGVDASREMVGAAEALVADAGDGLRARFTGRVAFAAEMPFADRSFDAAMSSFVLQLVPNRAEGTARDPARAPAGRSVRPRHVAGRRAGVRAGSDLRRAARRVRLRRGRGRRPTDRRHPVGRAGDGRAAGGGVPGRDRVARGARPPVHGRRLHRVPDRVRRADAVRGHGPGRSPPVPGGCSASG